MNDVIMKRLKQFADKNKNSVFKLRDWITRNMKSFSLIDALECIYLFTGGYEDKMCSVISQLTEKKKVYGRTQVYNHDDVAKIDIVKNEKGKLELRGYDPNWEAMPKGQHVQPNQKIFRKTDNQVSKTYQNSERKMMDFGKQVRDLYPGKSNMYITHAMQAIKNYANRKKVSVDKVVKSLEKGRLKILDNEYNSFEVVPKTFGESRVIIVNEDTVNLLKEDFEMTQYKFNNNIRSFLSSLLDDPVNAKLPFSLMVCGVVRSKLLSLMSSLGMIEREEKLSDTDINGEPKTVTMKVKYRIPKKNFDKNLRNLYIRLFEKNLPPRKVNEEEAGALSAASSGEYSQPLFPIQRRKMPTEVEEATTTSTTGNYEYDVPFAGDEETLSRKNGIGGSVSINKI